MGSQPHENKPHSYRCGLEGQPFVSGLSYKSPGHSSSRAIKTEMPVKTEMIEWMRVWLETPDAFAVWVKLRKSTAEWQALAARPPA